MIATQYPEYQEVLNTYTAINNPKNPRRNVFINKFAVGKSQKSIYILNKILAPTPN